MFEYENEALAFYHLVWFQYVALPPNEQYFSRLIMEKICFSATSNVPI